MGIMIKKLLTVVVSGLLFLSLSLFPVWANLDTNLSQATNSSLEKLEHISNIRERLLEKISLFFKFSPSEKAKYQEKLNEKRLAELSYVVEREQWDSIEEVSGRYSTYQGRLVDIITSNRMVDQKNHLLGTLDRHQQVLNYLISKLDPSRSFWRLVKYDIDTNEILKKVIQDQLK